MRRTHAGIRRTLGTAQLGKAPAGAFRRSELVSLDVADLAFTRAGLIVTRLVSVRRGP